MADLEHRDKLESSLSGKLASLSAEQRKAIELLLGTPPNVAHVPRQFWDKLQSDARNALAVVLIATFLKSLHGEQQYLDEDAEDAAYAWAEARSEAIAAGYMQNTKDRVYDVTKGAFATPSDEFDGEELVDDLDSIFGRSRADTIAATEVTTASTEAVRHVALSVPNTGLLCFSTVFGPLCLSANITYGPDLHVPASPIIHVFGGTDTLVGVHRPQAGMTSAPARPHEEFVPTIGMVGRTPLQQNPLADPLGNAGLTQLFQRGGLVGVTSACLAEVVSKQNRASRLLTHRGQRSQGRPHRKTHCRPVRRCGRPAM